MKQLYSRFFDYFFACASKLFVKYKYYLLVFFILFFISFMTGILTCAAYMSDISCDNLINGYLLGFLKNESGYFSFFLICSIYFVVVSLIFILFTRNLFFVVVNTIILCVMGYVFGFDACIIVVSLGLAGAILGTLVFGAMGLIVFGIYIMILSIAICRYREYKKSCTSVDGKSIRWMFFSLIVLGIVFIFVLCLLFSIIHIFVIVD